MSDEKVFLDEGGVLVTSARVALGSTTYATANVTSVGKKIAPVKWGCTVALILFGVLFGLPSLTVLLTGSISSNEPGYPLLLVMGLCSLLLVVAGVMRFRSLKPTYHVLISSASGEREGLSSSDQSLVDRVVAAISAAITHRG